MKGILKIYHPEETLKYHIQHSYCKAVYLNKQNLLELEIITDESLDHVEDDSLQYNFPQISLHISDFPVDSSELGGTNFLIEDSEEAVYTEINLYDDDEAFLHQNKLNFTEDENGELQLMWEGEIDDFYTGSEDLIKFKLKCDFKQDTPQIEEEE